MGNMYEMNVKFSFNYIKALSKVMYAICHCICIEPGWNREYYWNRSQSYSQRENIRVRPTIIIDLVRGLDCKISFQLCNKRTSYEIHSWEGGTVKAHNITKFNLRDGVTCTDY